MPKKTYEYLIQITPVANIASCWYGETVSGGRSRSRKFEKVIIHLKVGAQKKTTIRLMVFKKI